MRTVLTIILCTVMASIADAAEVDLFEQAMEAARQQNQPRTISCLQEFLKGSVGDTRIEQARQLLQQNSELYAARLARNGFASEAAARYLELAGFLAGHPEAQQVTDNAKRVMRDGLAAALKARRNQEALRLGSDWERMFKEEGPILSDAERLRLKIELLSAFVSQRAEPEYLRDTLLDVYSDPDADAAMQETKLSKFDVELTCAQRYAARGWHTASLAILAPLEQNASEEQTKKVKALTVESLLGRADGWISLGNVPETQKAIADCESYPGLPDRHPRLVKAKRAAQRLVGDSQAKLISFNEPIPGQATWSDEGSGLRVQREVRFGRRVDQPLKADVTVEAGALIEGGRLWVEHGRLSFQGLPDRPIVLRGVEVVCEYIGQIEAANVVFEDCTFAKGGGRFWVGGYSSSWKFDNCLVVRSNFRGLGYDYGLQLLNTTFYDCDLPKRELGRSPVENAAARFLDDRNDVQECTFINCRVAPSATWMTKRSNYYNCEIAHVPDTFRSTDNLEVCVFAPPADDEFRQRLELMSTSDDKGQLLLTFSAKPFPMPEQKRLWQYVSPPRGQALAPEAPARTQAAPPARANGVMVTDLKVCGSSDIPKGYELLGAWNVDAGGKDSSGQACRQMYLAIKRESGGLKQEPIVDFRVLGASGEPRPPAAGESTIATWAVPASSDQSEGPRTITLVIRRGATRFALTDVVLGTAASDEQTLAPTGYRVLGSWESSSADAKTGSSARKIVTLCAK